MKTKSTNITSDSLEPSSLSTQPRGVIRRRFFLRALGVTGAAVASGIGATPPAFAERNGQSGRRRGGLRKGDADILRFLAAAELIETDLWQQYTEVLNNGPFLAKLSNLDGDMAQYVVDNTDDELSHAEFLNAYLKSQGAEPVNLDAFRHLPSSPAAGARQIGRLTNLTALNVDTSWWLRYRDAGNPDFGATYPQFITITNRTAIPLRDNYTDNEIQAIANTAGFHFASIEQGGSSLYASLLANATGIDTIRILAGIGGVEVNHFAVWHDKAGNAPAVSVPGLVFPDLSTFDGDETRQKNLIFPEPCSFIDPALPVCSVIRPGTIQNSGAVAAANGLTHSGLFKGQPPAFFRTLGALALAADAARRPDDD